jgi:hypothetical protein
MPFQLWLLPHDEPILGAAFVGIRLLLWLVVQLLASCGPSRPSQLVLGFVVALKLRHGPALGLLVRQHRRLQAQLQDLDVLQQQHRVSWLT